MNPVPVASQPPSAQWNTLTGAEADRHRAVLERVIREGSAHAARLLETIVQDQPRDQVARARAIRFEPAPAGIHVQVGDDAYVPTDYALGQLAERAHVPGPYLRELAGPQAPAWQHELAAHILCTHHENAGDERVLVRSVRGQLRGYLSDRYRRLDSRPLLDALATEATRLGAVPIDGVATETRVALRRVGGTGCKARHKGTSARSDVVMLIQRCGPFIRVGNFRLVRGDPPRRERLKTLCALRGPGFCFPRIPKGAPRGMQPVLLRSSPWAAFSRTSRKSPTQNKDASR